MPEYPDITIYIEHLIKRLHNKILQTVRLNSPFLVRTADPDIQSIRGKSVIGFERLGKRIVFIFSDDYYLVLHLMIAGRLHWHTKLSKVPSKRGLAALDFPNGSLLITEAGTRKRASLHLVKGRESLSTFDRGGLEVFEASLDDFSQRLVQENHTIKRALTDPQLFSGIGNAYSDEILHRARISPVSLTQNLKTAQIKHLFKATRDVLAVWTKRLRDEAGDGFPEKITAFHGNMAVHGKFGKPCPECGTNVQRIRYAANETNYCPRCQTDGKLLADRGLSRLLKKDWPKNIEELEARMDFH